MGKLKLTGKQIRAIGFEEELVASVAMHTIYTHFKHHKEEAAWQILKDVLAAPENYLPDEVLSIISEKLFKESGSMEAPPLEGLGEVWRRDRSDIVRYQFQSGDGVNNLFFSF